MPARAPPAGTLDGPPEVLARLAAHGIRSVADALARSATVRVLPRRSNHRLDLDGACYRLKCARAPLDPPAELRALRRLARLGLPTARVAFWGVDPALGGLTATFDLAPFRPLDDLLREGRLGPPARRRTLRALAAAVADLHEAALHHRDLYLNHVFVDPAGSGRLALIDLERVGVHRRPLGRRVVKDLGALLASVPEGTVTPLELGTFLRVYGLRRALGPRALARLLARVTRKAARIGARTPRTPVGEAARPPAGTRP